MKDVEDFLDYDIESQEILEILNGKRPITDILDEEAIIEYLDEEHEKYCDDNNLCPLCHSYLDIEPHYEEYWGARMKVGEYWVCPNGCL